MVDLRLAGIVRGVRPAEIRTALQHVVGAGGKRLRAVILLGSCSAVGSSPRRALEAAAAVELLHCFTLVHDDIMDNAPTRRGKPTVHTRWGVGRGILAGDVLLGLAYHALLRSRHADVRTLADAFTRGFLDVCEGQGLDMNFGSRTGVQMRDYFRMIEKKTAALISLSAELGGTIGKGTRRQILALKRYGHHLGRAFQIQDDLLDVVGEEGMFGKKTGGDIREGKKTYLLLRATRSARGADRSILARVSGSAAGGGDRLVQEVSKMYRERGILDDAGRSIRAETERAIEQLAALPANRGSAMLGWLAGRMMMRTS
jgi:geranylgeranyl diphosphate synthase type II